MWLISYSKCKKWGTKDKKKTSVASSFFTLLCLCLLRREYNEMGGRTVISLM